MNREEWRKKSREQRAEHSRAVYERRVTEEPNRLIPPDFRPNILTPERKRYMEQCIGLARSAGLPVSGNAQFELSIPSALSGQIVRFPLEPLFQVANPEAAAEDYVKHLVEQHSRRLLLAQEFCANRLNVMTVAGDQAIMEWQRRSLEHPKSGVLPVILSGDLSKDGVRGLVAGAAFDFADAVTAAQKINVTEWFEQQRAQYEADGWIDESVVGHPVQSNPVKGELSAHLTSTGRQVRKRVTLVMLRVDLAWQAAILLQCGGWNDAPDAICQAAVLRYWQEKHGAMIASLGSDTMECIVEHPPTDMSAAMQLAWEHFLFCADSVHQGSGTIAALAEVLLESRYWHFWSSGRKAG